ncbi:MAG: hypothetical protein K2K11_00180, partial [Bacteroidales bacterium]|nr:hypothetical protein [Bacteroidales bacterium]
KPSYNSEEEGVVVVRIWVNPAGAVTRVQAGVKGTTPSIRNFGARRRMPQDNPVSRRKTAHLPNKWAQSATDS